MSMGMISLLMNLLMAGLLMATIFYSQKLNRSIRIMQQSKNDMAKLFAEFDESITRATESLQELKDAGKKADAILKDKLGAANLVADDLTFLIERGNKMADQLGGSVRAPVRAATPAPASETSAGTAPANSFGSSSSFGASLPKKDLPSDRPATPARTTTSSIESVLEQMANRNNKPVAGAGAQTDGRNGPRVRSKAEQELFDSLKSGH